MQQLCHDCAMTMSTEKQCSNLTALHKKFQNKLAPYGTDGRLFASDVSANVKVM